MSEKNIRVGIVAGETSGDILAAGLISKIKQQYPNATFEGIAGPRMQAQGCTTIFDMEELSVMGLVEVLSRIRRLLFVRKSLYQHFIANPPDIFIGVDAPDFNLRLELPLKKAGIKTVHYVSPTVWAWREKRVFSIAKATDLVLSLFPFEKQVYDKHNIPCQFVGHTMADSIALAPDKEVARKALKVRSDERVLALLPGSRHSEVSLLLDIFMQSAELLAKHVSDLSVLIPVVNKERKRQVEDYMREHTVNINYRVVIGHAREVMTASDAVLLASGTATLEAMLCKRPMVVAYRMSWLTHQMMKRLYIAKYFALPNILADEELVPELLQEDVNPQNIAEKLLHYFTQSEEDKTALVARFTQLHEVLKRDADAQAARAVLALIEPNQESN
ncbi:Lipid-A-disaccharide synthase [Paraglaciecola mesophila]|uniref:Lipid-A-disaccharide synthase n=1 Tax=Paraglaciecola mesophila TaxID=197222 RepID=A0A857JIT8_9ALTE|nr:lipid-A-disaccharide synthase [Paraglaciecola mesophila]QHJ11212.1 Lipid-A-disaccharide synthase [Paraglaciecola mesophila]